MLCSSQRLMGNLVLDTRKHRERLVGILVELRCRSRVGASCTGQRQSDTSRSQQNFRTLQAAGLARNVLISWRKRKTSRPLRNAWHAVAGAISEAVCAIPRSMTAIGPPGRAGWIPASRPRRLACYGYRFQIDRGSADTATSDLDIPGGLPIACHRWGTLAQSMWRQTLRYLLITVSRR